MNKKIELITTFFLVLVLIVLGVLVTINFSGISKNFNVGTVFNLENPPKYHFMLIVDGTDKNYVKEIRLGAQTAADDYDVVFELREFEGERKDEEILRQFDIAVESDVDGIIIQAFDDERFADILSKANYREIPVTTIGTDIPQKETVSYISYNEYQIGSQIGSLVDMHFNEENIHEGTIVLLQNSSYNGQDSGSAMKEKLDPGFTFKPVSIDYNGEDTLNAEGVTRGIISQYDDLVAIICSSGEETLGVVQALKDMNKINKVLVIGSDDYTEILDYIDRDVIFATIVADNERLGYESIVNMVEHNNGQFVSQYKDIKVNIISNVNLSLYRKEVDERYEAK